MNHKFTINNDDTVCIENNRNEKININQLKIFALNKTTALLRMCRVLFYNDTVKLFS